MFCPYCQNPLKISYVNTKSDQQAEVHECLNCGGHWFPRWLANDISLNAAKNVDSILPHSQVPKPEQPRCPNCSNRLSLIQHDSVARGVTVWSCPQGHGNFFPIHELFKFKQAQEAKITYHQVWGIPIKSVFAVLLPAFAVLLIAAGVPVFMQQISTQQETRTKASQTIRTPLVTQLSPTSAIISFISTTPVTSQITIKLGTQTVLILPVSETPQTTHTITVDELQNKTQYTFTINYTPASGPAQISDAYPLFLN